jgi:hypothetical protein
MAVYLMSTDGDDTYGAGSLGDDGILLYEMTSSMDII